MRKSTARVALVGAALLSLGVIGAGAATAAPAPGVSTAAATRPTALGPFERIGRRAIHATVIVQKRDGTLVTMQLDRGTIAAIGSGTVTVSEVGGTTQTVTTNTATRVRRNGVKSTLSNLVVGDRVSVVSVVQGSTPVAQLIVVPRPVAAQLPAPTN